MSDRRPRRHPRVFWTAVVIAALLLGGGVLVAALGYSKTSGPDGAVRGYFAALARSDAPDALAFGDIPAGPHTLLTSTVLREQQRIAPMSKFSITSVRRNGSRATVKVTYSLGFAAGRQRITDSVPVHETGGSWRLSRSAVATQLEVVRAAQRATVVGAGVPEGTVLLFPGALPVRFDTPYLRLEAVDGFVRFGAGPTTAVFAEVSPAGKRAARAAVSAALGSCLSAGTSVDPRCPQPTERYVPGSLRGTLVAGVDDLTIDLASGDAGTFDVSGTVRVKASYRKLTFQNRSVSGSGTLKLPIRATSYAIAPLRIRWDRES